MIWKVFLLISKSPKHVSVSLAYSNAASFSLAFWPTFCYLAFIADYIDATSKILLSSITSAKRNLQYDLDKKLETIKLCFRMESQIEKKPALKEILEMSLPMKNLDDFLKFEDSLNSNKEENEENVEKTLEKQKALVIFSKIIVN